MEKTFPKSSICGMGLIHIQSTPSKTNFESIHSEWIGIPTIPIIPTLMSYKITGARGAPGMFQGQLSNIGKGHYCGWTDSRPCGTFSCLCSLLTLSLWHWKPYDGGYIDEILAKNRSLSRERIGEIKVWLFYSFRCVIWDEF